jgi:FdrA protein
MTDIIFNESDGFSDGQKYVRGLYSGGSLCEEAILVLSDFLGDIHSNVPQNPELKLEDSNVSKGHCAVDMGEEEFTKGKPHPMIDFTLRRERMIQEAKDAETAVILLDVVLGYGAHKNPAGELVPAIMEAKGIAEKEGRYLSFVTSICGTEDDPQNFKEQKKQLEEARVVIMPGNAQAARLAAMIATRGGSRG